MSLARFFGQCCLLCGAGGAERALCDGCAAELPALPPHCPRCAMPSPAGAVCGRCLRRAPAFDRTVALWRYEFPCDRLVQSLKYHARLALAGFFARALAERAFPAADLIVPMPLHPRRIAERGFNQALEIARPLAALSGVQLDARAVRRIADTAPQAGLPLEKRAANVRGAFRCDRDLGGKSILVVDDVMTTGATLQELALTLKRAGALRVENWVLARTLPG